MNTNDRITLIRLASRLPAKSVERRAILAGLQTKEAGGILEKLFARYRKDHPNSKAPPQSLRDEAAELEKEKKEKAEKEKAEKEKGEKEKKEKAEKAEKEKKEKSDKKDKEVSDLSDKDLDDHVKEHEGKAEKRLQKDKEHLKKQEEDDYDSGYGGRGYYTQRRLDKDEQEDAEHHERLKKEKDKRTKKNTPAKNESKPSLRKDVPQYEGDEGGGVPSWVRGASLSVGYRNTLIRLASTMGTGSKERRAILTGLARQAAGLGTWTMTQPYRGEVDSAFIRAVKREFPDLYSEGRVSLLVLADYFDDPRYNGGSEYDVTFRAIGPNIYEISFPATNGKKLISFLSKALNVRPS